MKTSKTTLTSTVLGSLALVTSLLSHQANAYNRPDMFYTIISCRDARPIADAGVVVSIRSGGFAGITQILVGDQSIVGPKPFGKTTVTEEGTLNSGSTFYSSSELLLQIYPSSYPLHSGMNSAGRKARILGMLNERVFANELICYPVARPMN